MHEIKDSTLVSVSHFSGEARRVEEKRVWQVIWPNPFFVLE
jgi:hypothetical protein